MKIIVKNQIYIRISRKTEADEKQNELLESIVESTEQSFYRQQRLAIITLIISFFFSTVIGVILDGIAKYKLENESGIICQNDGYMVLYIFLLRFRKYNIL